MVPVGWHTLLVSHAVAVITSHSARQLSGPPAPKQVPLKVVPKKSKEQSSPAAEVAHGSFDGATHAPVVASKPWVPVGQSALDSNVVFGMQAEK